MCHNDNCSNAITGITAEINNGTDTLHVYDHYDNISEIARYIRLGLACIGLVCNILALVVFCRQRRNKLSSFIIYWKALAILDIFTLLSVSLISHGHTGTWAFLTKNEVGCRLGKFLSHACPTMSAWTLAFLSLDRAVTICCPITFSIFCTRRKAIIVLLILTVLVSGYYSHNFATRYVKNERCSVRYPFFSQMNDWIHLSLYSLVPSIMITFFNAKIIQHLQRQAKFRRRTRSVFRSYVPDKQITTQLIAVSLFFLITTSFYTFGTIWHQTSSSEFRYLITAIGSVFMVMNHSCNFLILIMSGSKYRSDLKEICRCVNGKKKKPVRVRELEGTRIQFTTQSDETGFSDIHI